jgi:hypothetical protein
MSPLLTCLSVARSSTRPRRFFPVQIYAWFMNWFRVNHCRLFDRLARSKSLATLSSAAVKSMSFTGIFGIIQRILGRALVRVTPIAMIAEQVSYGIFEQQRNRLEDSLP